MRTQQVTKKGKQSLIFAKFNPLVVSGDKLIGLSTVKTVNGAGKNGESQI